MHDRARSISRFHAVLFVLALAGLAFAVASTIADDEPASAAVRFERFLSYFTILSNMLVAGVSAVLVRRPLIDTPLWRVVRIGTLMSIIITGLIYLIVLRPDSHLEGAVEVVGNALRHYIVPPLAVIGWALLGPWPRQEWGDLGKVMLWPLAFAVFTLAHGAVTGWYPYDFIDVAEHGYGSVLVQSLFTAAEMAAIAAELIWLGRRWSRTRETAH